MCRWVRLKLLPHNPVCRAPNPGSFRLSAFQLLTDKGEVIVENEEEQVFHAFGPDGVFHPFQLAGRLPVMPGSYSLEFRIVDRQKARVYYGEKKFTVGKPGATSLAGPLFFSAAKQVTKPDGAAPSPVFRRTVPAACRRRTEPQGSIASLVCTGTSKGATHGTTHGDNPRDS